MNAHAKNDTMKTFFFVFQTNQISKFFDFNFLREVAEHTIAIKPTMARFLFVYVTF